MRNVVILGGGTAGTMVANRLRATLASDWEIVVIDRDDSHHYQPGYLFIPFGTYSPQQVVKPRGAQFARGVTFRQAEVARVEVDAQQVRLTDGQTVDYQWLVIASGSRPRPDLVPGLTDAAIWQRSAFEFYTLEGAIKLRDVLAGFAGGKILVHICEMPIKCPVAPLEFAFLVEDYFRKRRMRHKVDITFVTPLDGAFTKPVASKTLGSLLDDRSIRVETDFAVERVAPEQRKLVSYHGRELPFDLLVTVPPNTGAQFVSDSGLGNELGFVPVDKHTLRSANHPQIFVLGDAADVPTSKAGAVAHFEAELFVANLLAAVEGKPLPSSFDGHANCFVECGRGEALLLDFNYETQPLTGTFPWAGIGPMQLLKRSRMNHLGKLAFEQIYWRVLLPGHNLPISASLSMTGKKVPTQT